MGYVDFIRNRNRYISLLKSRQTGFSFVVAIKGLVKALDPARTQYTKQFVSYNEEDAQDILHDSFVKILTNIDKVDENWAYVGWMKTIVVNTAINAYRERAKTSGSVDIDDVQETIEDVRIETSDFLTRELLLKFISELPEGYRTVFNLYEIDGYSHLEITQMTGISYSTVRSQLFKAKRALKKKIEKYLGEIIEK